MKLSLIVGTVSLAFALMLVVTVLFLLVEAL
jgi:hypothetical protein